MLGYDWGAQQYTLVQWHLLNTVETQYNKFCLVHISDSFTTSVVNKQYKTKEINSLESETLVWYISITNFVCYPYLGTR